MLRQFACLVFNPIKVNNYVSLFNCTPVGRASDYDGHDLKLFILVVRCLVGRFSSVAWPTGVQLVILFCFRFSVMLFVFPGLYSC